MYCNPAKTRKENFIIDILMLERDMDQEGLTLDQKISDLERRYLELANCVEKYDQELNRERKKVKDIFLLRGLNEAYSDTTLNLESVRQKMLQVKEGIEQIAANLKKIKSVKKDIDLSYCQLMMEARVRFNLEEVKVETLERIERTFCPSGSDRNIATVAWYTTVIKLRNRFNPRAVKFPMVFDSPKNSEMDQRKIAQLQAYLIDNSNLSGQFILSGIGLREEGFADKVDGPINMVVLENAPFHLLQSDDFEEHQSILKDLIGAQVPEAVIAV